MKRTTLVNSPGPSIRSYFGDSRSFNQKGRLIRRAKWPVIKGATATRRDTYSGAVLSTSDVVNSARPDEHPTDDQVLRGVLHTTK
jgi:hypothetical protein